MKKTKTKKIVVDVTQNHINEGVKNINTGHSCIIALALKDKYPGSEIEVFYESVYIDSDYYAYSEQMRRNQLKTIRENCFKGQKTLKQKIKPFKFYLARQ